MKIDRRSFLSFVIGGAAGTALSPLPWKLTDDLAIWSQNWPWTPVPANGEVSHVHSACTLCPGGCGITVRKVEDRAVKIEGMTGHPVNNGGVCILGLSGLQLLYGPTRVQAPLKRKGNRGEGRWERVSWDSAVSEAVARLEQLRKTEQSHQVGCIAGSDRGTIPSLLNRFLTVYGSPNFLRTPSIQDTYELTLHLMQGFPGTVGFDIEHADFVLGFGSGTLEGWGSPVRMFRANSRLRKAGGTVVQIESRLSKTAAKSDQWIPIHTGTETALALGIAHILVRDSLYDKNFVDNHAFGFNDWTDPQGKPHKGFKSLVLEAYGLDQVSGVTGVDKAVIESTAKAFAKAAKPLALYGRGRGAVPGSLSESMAVHALNALVGNINRKGGVWSIPETNYFKWPEAEMDGIASAGIQKGRLDEAESDRFPHTRYLMNRFFENVQAGKPYPIQLLLVSEANPLYTQPDTARVKGALDKIPFIVSFSSYMDETARYADLILPNHVYLERYEDVPYPAGLQRPMVSLARPVVAPQYDTRHTGDILLQIAKGLGGSVSRAFPWKTYETCLEDTLGKKLDTLLKQGFWVDTQFSPAGWGNAFSTASEKFEFVSEVADGTGPVPRYEAVDPEGDGGTFPLLLIPYDSMRMASGPVGNPPFLTKTIEDTVLKGDKVFVEINPETARKLGLAEGKSARLTTPKGAATVRIHLYEGIIPGVVALPRGLGHTAYDDYLANKGVNVNDLIGPVPDSVSGLDAAWGIRAKLSKA